MIKARRKFVLIGLITILAISLFQGMAEAKNGEDKDFTFKLTGRYFDEAGISNNEGGFSVLSTTASLTYSKLTLTYSRADISWKDVDKLPFGNGKDEPFSNLHDLSLLYNDTGKISSKWRYFAAGGIASSFENEIGDYKLNVMGGLNYILSPRWSFQFGLIASYMEIKTLVIPIVGFRYRPEKDGTGFSFNLGMPEAYVSYNFTRSVAVRANLRYDVRIYKLDDDSTLEPEGYLERNNLTSGLFLDYSPTQNLKLTVGVIDAFSREWTVYNKDGDKTHDYTVDDALGGLIRLDYSF